MATSQDFYKAYRAAAIETMSLLSSVHPGLSSLYQAGSGNGAGGGGRGSGGGDGGDNGGDGGDEPTAGARGRCDPREDLVIADGCPAGECRQCDLSEDCTWVNCTSCSPNWCATADDVALSVSPA